MFRTTARQLKFTLRGRRARGRARPRSASTRQKGEYQIVCDRIEPLGRGRAAARVRAVEAAARGGRPLRRRRGSARCRPCRGRSGSSPRSTAPRVRDIVTRPAARYPSAHVVIRPRACRAMARRSKSRAGSRPSRVSPDVDVIIVGARRRIDRGSLGVQRGGRGPRHRRVPDARDLGRRARDGLHHRRLRRRRARRDTVGRCRDSSPRRREGVRTALDRGQARLAAAIDRRLLPAPQPGPGPRHPSGARRLAGACRAARPAGRRAHAGSRARAAGAARLA